MKKRQVALPSSKQDDNHHHHHHHHQFSRNSTNSWCNLQTVWYGECQRNQAANVGGFAVDGCREFMPCGEDGSTGALTCAACGCHRNFHRREVEPEAIYDYCSSRGSSSTWS